MICRRPEAKCIEKGCKNLKSLYTSLSVYKTFIKAQSSPLIQVFTLNCQTQYGRFIYLIFILPLLVNQGGTHIYYSFLLLFSPQQ